MRKGIFAAFLLVAFAAIVLLALVQGDRRGEEFTPEQRAFLESQEPRGKFTTRHTFRVCQDGAFAYYYADWAFVATREQCWSHLLPVVPSFLPTRP